MVDKYFPKGFTLETPRVLLEPVAPRPTPAPAQNALASECPAAGATPPTEGIGNSRIVFNITDLHTKLHCGTAAYNNISFENKSVEISWNWINPDDADQGLIKNLKFAMLSYGFQVMKMENIVMTGDGSMTIKRNEWQSVKETFFPELM
jgi:hypothetical protein